MDCTAYLRRLDVTGSVTPDLAALHRLMAAHLRRIPFENLDLHLDAPIRLDVERFYRKVVLNRRGGGCYELNGLFAELLRSIGFKVRLVGAQVLRASSQGDVLDHLALAVELDGSLYLVDVGFGDSFRAPMLIRDAETQCFYGRCAQLKGQNGYYHLELRDGERFDKGYRFDLEPRRLEFFEAARRRNHEMPESWFVRNRVAIRQTEDGAYTLVNDELRSLQRGRAQRRRVGDAEYLDVLRRYFGVDLVRLPRTKGDRLVMRARRATGRVRRGARTLLAAASAVTALR